MDKNQLSPEEVVLDLVLAYSDKMPAMGHASVLNGNLHITTKNHLEHGVSLTVPVYFSGRAQDGDEPRFVLCQIAQGAWKLVPSIRHPLLHAYITIIGVPDVLTLLRNKEVAGQ